MHTIHLQESVDKDVHAIQEAWDEHKRLEDAEKSSFANDQVLNLAQVFQKVHNSLSLVISLSEITTLLMKDSIITPDRLIPFVDEMLHMCAILRTNCT